jgi:hypothetical protein
VRCARNERGESCLRGYLARLPFVVAVVTGGVLARKTHLVELLRVGLSDRLGLLSGCIRVIKGYVQGKK